MNLADYHFVLTRPDCEEVRQFVSNKWAKIKKDESGISYGVNIVDFPLIKDMLEYLKDKPSTFLILYTLNEMYRNGPKIVKPTFEQCLALEQIEVNIELKEYKQPFPSLGVLFPLPYIQYLKKGLKNDSIPLGDLGIIYWNGEIIILSHHYRKQNKGFAHTIFKDIVIEDYFSVAWKGIEYLKKAQRVMINLSLLMISEGMERIGYENIKRQRELERQDRRDGGNRRKREFYYIGLKQEIPLFKKAVIREKVEETLNGETGERRSPRPHWRKGHLRRVCVGKGKVDKKIVFIRPVFVCSENYRGDMTDTSVTYEG